MKGSTVGIKIADGSYYPIVDEDGQRKKRLILTTVFDNQSNVQIDLYRGGEGDTIEDAAYISSLMIEEIPPAPKGKPEIELVVGFDQEGVLHADAKDLSTDQAQSLSVSLDSVEAEGSYEIADRDLDLPASPVTVVSSPQEELSSEGSQKTELFEKKQAAGNQKHPIRLLLVIFLALVLVALLFFLVFNFTQTPAAPREPQAESGEAVESGETAQPQATGPEESGTGVSEGVELTEAPSAPEATAPGDTPQEAAQPSSGVAGEVRHRIKWGDTLWDISKYYYRTPWLYGKIAKRNNIKNPDLIFANTTIIIPQQ